MAIESAYPRTNEGNPEMPNQSTAPEQVRPGITISGPFIPEAMGLYVVTVRCGECEAQAQIRVSATKPVKKKDGDGHEQKCIRWSGTIPPQKWTTFYMKVVSPFASTAGLKLTVEIEVLADLGEDQAKAQIEKIRTAIRDLGLDHDPELI
jgi:hypothetical protein